MSFYEVLTQAIRDITENGYDSAERVAYWMQRLREAAESTLVPEFMMEKLLNDAMRAIYTRLIERGGLLRTHYGVSRFTLEKVKPQLRAELDRRILASANLIKLNREESIGRTLQRFSGWSTSIPKGGSRAVPKAEVKDQIRKPLAQLPFEERRVLIDQGHKFASELSNILATDGGAIAAIWHSHYRQIGYNYRQDHKERDDHIYTVRGNWALERGFMKVGPKGYTDQITKPGEEVFCRCYYQYIYALRVLPDEMITEKGRQELARVRKLREAA